MSTRLLLDWVFFQLAAWQQFSIFPKAGFVLTWWIMYIFPIRLHKLVCSVSAGLFKAPSVLSQKEQQLCANLLYC